MSEIIKQISYGDESISEYVKRLLDVMEYDNPYTLSALKIPWVVIPVP